MVPPLDNLSRIVRLEERDRAREGEIVELKEALKDSTSAIRGLNATMSKFQIEAAFAKGRERGFTIVGGSLGGLLVLAGEFLLNIHK